jgi:hypothetical protein
MTRTGRSGRRAVLLPTVAAILLGAAGFGVFSWVRGSGSAGSGPQPSPTAIPTAVPSGPVAFIGCSNTKDAVAGYQALGGQRLWPAVPGFGGGTVKAWALNIGTDSFKHWAATTLQDRLRGHPGTRAVWWQLCALADQDDATNYAAALDVLAEIRKLFPGATVYVSALNGFLAPHVCDLAGAAGPKRLQALADRLVRMRLAAPGPKVGALRSAFQTPSAGTTAQNNETGPDGCHPNDAGDRKLGRSLLASFGR